MMQTSLSVILFLNLFHTVLSVSTTDGRQCVFPFIYEKKEYNSCTTAGSNTGQLWCAVTRDYDQDGLWGYCGAETQPDFSNCPLVADVTFIIEPFVGFTDDDWYTTSTFLKRFIDNFPISSINTRVAFLSTDMQETFYLNKYYERNPMKAFIDGWKRPQSIASMAELFNLASNTIYTRDNGDRADVDNIVVVIVNGQGSTDKSNDASVRAFLLQQKATMYAVGVSQIGEDLATKLVNDQSRVVSAPSFRDLNTIVFPQLISSLCKSNNNNPGPATPAPATTCSQLQVAEMTPNFGSVLGGTEVTIVGCQLAVGTEVPTIYMGDSTCQINSLSSTVIVCTTGASTNAASTVVEMKIQPTASVLYKTSRYFNYVYDNEAIISEIIPSPPKTIVRGSIAITVKGENLPGGDIKLLMVISTSNIQNLKKTDILCRSVNNTMFVCQTPDLTPYIPQEVRRKRSLVENANSVIQYLLESFRTKRRRKRQIRNARIDSPGYFEVDLGIQMTTNRKYTDLGRLFPLATKLQVYNNPNLFSFGKPQKFRPFAPFNQKTIIIKGERLNQGVRAEDYQIAVGNSLCKVVQVTYNELQCEPPQVPDPPDSEFVAVNIHVGPIIFSPGNIDYDRNQWEDMGFRAGIGFFIFGFIVIVTIIWVIVACCLQKRIDKADPNVLPPPPEQKKEKKTKRVKKVKKPKKREDHRNDQVPLERVETPSQASELSDTRMYTGVSVDGYDRRDWAY